MTIENGKITSTMLGIEDHGILSAYLTITFASGGCSFGGYSLDSWSAGEKRRVGTAFGTECIIRILDTVGVEKWEDLKGAFVRVAHTGLGGVIEKIGNLIEDKWFSFKELSEQYSGRNQSDEQ
ncbi:MAG: hypothetical protein LBN00_06450 [Oscillospiraceae bacterium]|jgi:hypothetical protein|nr:hypothetical protein [Oscillospiraceae bacterium]